MIPLIRTGSKTNCVLNAAGLWHRSGAGRKLAQTDANWNQFGFAAKNSDAKHMSESLWDGAS
jgi:hypothetical protein